MRAPKAQRVAGMCGGLAIVIAGALGFSASALAESKTFKPAGPNEFAVPAGVAQVQVTAVGGAGEPGGECLNDGYPANGAGGSGAKVTATLPVIGVKTLYVNFGGGGNGGPAGSGCVPPGGAGGGASDVRTEPGPLSSRLIVAGGGGGGGSGDAAFAAEDGIFAGAGGSANELTGGNGTNSEFREFGFGIAEAAGGEGGGTSSAGTGGTGNGATCTGGSGVGGTGGSGTFKEFNCGSGGGGGGGYFGGGAGGASNNASAGGGAGSSYIAPSAEGEVASGAGEPQEVVITYTVPSPPKAVIGPAAGGSAYVQGAVVKTEFSCSEGEGGPGIESCKDSNGGSGASGTLNTASLGTHTYTVTAKSKDGQTGEATISYAVVAPTRAAATADSSTVAPVQTTAVTPKVCVSQRDLAIHVARHVILPAGTTIKSAKVLLAGRVVARLAGSDPVVHVTLAGLRRGAFKVTIVARTSTGKTRTAVVMLAPASAPNASSIKARRPLVRPGTGRLTLTLA